MASKNTSHHISLFYPFQDITYSDALLTHQENNITAMFETIIWNMVQSTCTRLRNSILQPFWTLSVVALDYSFFLRTRCSFNSIFLKTPHCLYFFFFTMFLGPLSCCFFFIFISSLPEKESCWIKLVTIIITMKVNFHFIFNKKI